MLRVIELFAGVGAQRAGLIEAGLPFEIIGISEIDKFAIQTYTSLWGETPNLGDITSIEQLPEADLWTYSFPCTDISAQGRQAGIHEGTRSGLLLQVKRLLLKAKETNTLPKYLLLENVKNLVSKKFLPDFNNWLKFLQELGYKSYWKILNANDYGVPQIRERVFVVSSLDPNFKFNFTNPFTQNEVWDFLEPQETISAHYKKDYAPRRVALENLPDKNNYIIDAFYYTSRKPHYRGVCPTFTTKGQQDIFVYYGGEMRQMTLREMWRLMGFKDEWIDRIKVSQTQQRKQAGNSICVNCLTAIFRELKEIEGLA